MIRSYHAIICLFLLLLGVTPIMGQQLAFPTAEGFGRYTTGGRGGEVYEVTNLDDSGPGSLREGVNMSGARTIVFRVSGTINLLTELKITKGNLTIAGQTAPGDGIALQGSGVVIQANNIIIRYIRFRPGDISGGEPDAIWGRNQKDIIIDHCSMSWAVDETSSFYDNENFTMQWCLLSESLFESQHEKGRHGYGGIWGGQGATFHHNILAHHSSRTPRFNGSRYSNRPDLELVDFRNNVIYNWGGNSAYGGEGGNHNMVANYFKPGPAATGEKRYRILDAYPLNGILGTWFVDANFVEGYPEVTADNWNGGVQRLTAQQVEDARLSEPLASADIQTQTAEQAFLSALENSGATLPRRDAVDSRIINEVENGIVNFGGVYGALKGIIDSQEQVGGWPQLFSAPAPLDSDHDGIPDFWETENNLNPENPDDGKIITDNGYSNLENYLNSLEGVVQPDFIKHPTGLSGEVSMSRIELSWINHHTEQEGDEVVVERSLDGADFSAIAELPSQATTFIDEDVESGETYFYRLKVIKGQDASAYSQPASFSTGITPVNPNPEHLVGYWTFDATSGVVVRDVSTYENNGRVENAQGLKWVPGKANHAIDLNGLSSSGHVSIPHADQIGLGVGSFSVSFWMKAQLIEQAYIFHKGTFAANAATGATGKWFGLEMKGGLIRFAVDDDVVKTEVGSNNSEFLNGEWVHVVAVRDVENKKLRLFRNGALSAEIADETMGGIGHTDPLILGNSNDLNAPFNGILDEFRIYSYSLNASEVAGLFEGIPVKASTPTPADKAVGMNSGTVNLTWSGSSSKYDLYTGTTSGNLTQEASDVLNSSYELTGISNGVEYFWRVDAKGTEGTVVKGDVWSFTTEAITSTEDKRPDNRFKLFPNPISGYYQVEFTLSKSEPVFLAVYDVHNRLIHTPINRTLEQGVHQLHEHIADSRMNAIPNGLYYFVLKTSEQNTIKRFLLLR